MSYISVENLSKKYKIKNKDNKKRKKGCDEIIALQAVNFTIEKGDIIGYIGPNGAGKSTTIKLLSGILKPDSGSCMVNGEIPWENRKKYVKKIGVLFGQRSQLLWDLPARDTFDMLRSIYDMNKVDYSESLNYLENKLDLSSLLDKPVRQMSLGQRMRCEFAATFIHNPELVFLDEPTIGIDIEMKEKIHNFIEIINREKNVTVFITSHDIDDIQTLCNRIIIVNKGEIYYDGRISEICNKGYINHKITVELLDDAILKVGSEYGVEKLSNRKFCVSVKDEKEVGMVVNYIAKQNDVQSICVEKANLEEILLKIYKSLNSE